VLNNSPFFGIINPTGKRNPECSFLGSGETVSEFVIDYKKCKLHYDKVKIFFITINLNLVQSKTATALRAT
jgi:hypothetical protein